MLETVKQACPNGACQLIKATAYGRLYGWVSVFWPVLCNVLDMPQGTVSRNVKLMSQYCDRNAGDVPKKGYGLLETDHAPENRYQLAVYLINKGEQLVEKLARVMGQDESSGFSGHLAERTVEMKKQALP